MSDKYQLAVRVSMTMAVAAKERAWEHDRELGLPEASGFMQRWLHGLVEADLRARGYWPPNGKNYAGTAPRSPHTGRPSHEELRKQADALDARSREIREYEETVREEPLPEEAQEAQEAAQDEGEII